MILKISRTILSNCYRKSFVISARNLSNKAVPLSYLEFPKDSNSDSNLIVLHGLFGSKSNWNSLCKAFAAKTSPQRKIFAIDARNHGDSTHSVEHNYELMAEDIRQFMEDRSLQKSAVLGHSMGGRAMIYFALKYPELVEKLVVVDISPRGRIGTTQSDIPLFINAMRSTEIPNSYTIHQGRNVADEKLKTIISEKSLRDFLITNLAKDESGDFRWRINLETLDRCFQEGIAQFPDVSSMQFKGPTLFIGGSKSDYLK
jgi:abhydrolase domain-containing protein 11